jgi:hypothetical protein
MKIMIAILSQVGLKKVIFRCEDRFLLCNEVISTDAQISRQWQQLCQSFVVAGISSPGTVSSHLRLGERTLVQYVEKHIRRLFEDVGLFRERGNGILRRGICWEAQEKSRSIATKVNILRERFEKCNQFIAE